MPEYNLDKIWPLIFDTMSDFVLLIDKDFNIVKVNKGFIKFIGKKEMDLIGKKCYNVIHGIAEPFNNCPLNRLIKSKKFESEEFYDPFLKKWLYVRSSPLFGDKGNLTGSIHIISDIDKRKKAEQELRENELKYRHIIENAKALVMITQPDAVVSYLSPSCKEILGHYPGELVGTVPNIFYPEDNKKVQQVLHRALKGESGTGFEYRIVTKEGKTKWISHSWSPVFEGDKLKMIISIVTDISERKQVEEQLKESEERFRGAFETAAIGMAIADLRGHFIKTNESYCNIVGHSEKELLLKTYMDITHPDDVRNDVELATDLAKGKIPYYHLEKRYIHKNGRIIWVILSVSLVRDPNGAPLYYFALVQDITDRKKAEQDLIANEEKLKSLISNIPGVIYRCANDPEWTMEYISDQIEAISGHPQSDFIKNRVRSYASIIYPDDRIMVNDIIQESIKDKKPYTLEYRILHNDGSIRWVYEKGQGVFNERGELLYLDGAIFDITERKNLEAELKRKLQDMEKFHRAAVDRELKMIQLKKRIEQLEAKLKEK